MSAPFSGTYFNWTDPDTLWNGLLRPWFAAGACIGWEGRDAAAAGAASPHPSLLRAQPMLLAPDAGLIAWVKSRVVAESIGCLGVHFHSVGTLRGVLARAYGVQGRIALREDLHLIMGQAARSLPDNPVAQAAALDPAGLVRLCDRADRAGWRQDGLATEAGRELAARYFELLEAYGLRTAASMEREILQAAEKAPLPACGYLLAIGFGPEHADSMPLLRAATLSARQAIVCLDAGSAAASGVAGATGSTSASALAWQGACEEYFGTAIDLEPSETESSEAESPEPSEAEPSDEATGAIPLADSASTSASGAGISGSAATEGQLDMFGLLDAAPSDQGKSPAPIAADASATANTVPARTAGGSVPAVCVATLREQTAEALAGWADALAAHRSVEPHLQVPLQRGLRLQTFRNLRDEAQNAVRLVRGWLRESAADGTAQSRDSLRIGIVLPEGGSLLGREIAAELSALGIAHYDSLGHQPARTAAQQLLENWCAWQTSNQLDDFNVFARELARQGRLGAEPLSTWERHADNAFMQTLCADLDVIRAFLGDLPARAQPAATGSASAMAGAAPAASAAAASAAAAISAAASASGTSGASAAAGRPRPHWRQLLADWPQLPAQAAFSQFWEMTKPVLELLGWPPRPEPLFERVEVFASQPQAQTLPRQAFIAWLRSVTRVPGRTRSACGHEPFAAVQLVNLAEASRQNWSHLCLVGMVHTLWPPQQPDSALLDASRCAQLNSRAERPSRFGLGQSVIGGGHTFLASGRERREWFEAAFLRLLRQSGAGVLALSRYRFEPSSGSAEVFASEYFLRSVYAATGSLEIGESPAVAAAAAFPAVATATTDTGTAAAATGFSPAAEDAEHRESSQGGHGDLQAPEQAGVAYLRRRDPDSGFDAYSYSLLAAPLQPLRLSCSHWAEVLSRPANAWYRYVLRVKKRTRASETDVRRQSRGNWIHRWVNPSPEQAGRRAAAAAVGYDGAEGSEGAAGSTAAIPALGGADLRSFIVRPDANAWRDLVYARAASLRGSVQTGYEGAGRSLPQWWHSDWAAALALAFNFADVLAAPQAGSLAQAAGDSALSDGEPTAAAAASPVAAASASFADDWVSAAGEWRLPAQCLHLPGHPLDGLPLEGVVDLLLSPLPVSAVAAGSPSHVNLGAHPALWLIDYKTGGDENLSLRAWESRAAGLQLVLYAFALRQLGAQHVQMTILKPGAQLLPQLSLEEIRADAPVWNRLLPPMRLGVFGSQGALRDAHSFGGDYPLATLAVDPVLLERKAALTLAAATAGGAGAAAATR